MFYALSDGVGLRALGTEYYTLLSPALPAPASPPAPPAGESGASWESDLFAGIG
jgi:hypothetical protein